jgi:energy-converting hydrogenase Eha subunit C
MIEEYIILEYMINALTLLEKVYTIEIYIYYIIRKNDVRFYKRNLLALVGI